MKRISNLSLIIIVLTSAAMVLGACSSTTAPMSEQEIAAIRAYADPATQITLQGLSEDNLTKYTQFGNDKYKAAVTQVLLDKAYDKVNSELGSFVSITFSSIEKQDIYIIVHYKAKYSNGNVGIRMVFDQDHLVAGQWFE